MPRYPQQKVDTIEAIAVALAVYKQQGNKVVKYLDGVLGNKELIVEHYANVESTLELDLAAAEKVKQIIDHQILMTSISSKTVSEFTMKVHEAIKQDTVSNRNFGIIAWAPKIADDLTKAMQVKDDVYRIGLSSRYIGQEHRKITLTYNEIDSRYMNYYNSFVHTGHDEHGNLVHFYSKNKIPNGSIIVAKVKSHGTGRHALVGANVTYLHYVKEAK